MTIPIHKKRVAFTLTEETLNQMDELMRFTKVYTRSDMVGAVFQFIDIGECKDLLKRIMERKRQA